MTTGVCTYWFHALRRLASFLIILYTSGPASAQSMIRANASIDTTVIRIGEQFKLGLSVTIPADAQLFFPAIPDTIQKLEVVQRSAIDTLKSTDGQFYTYHQSATLTGFDSGFFVVEPFTFYFTRKGNTGRDSLSTEALLMQVQTIAVDTTQAIKDIKPPIDVPFTFAEAMPYILAGLAAIGLIWLIVYQLKKRKRKPAATVRKVPSRPAHELALEALEKIRDQKLWQQGFYKEYHSGVADTVRTYIENRFGIPSMEMPSDDTLSHFRGKLVGEETYEKLRYLLQLADMVKFAKGIPVGSENELSMLQAVEFISMTRPAIKEDVELATKERKEDLK